MTKDQRAREQTGPADRRRAAQSRALHADVAKRLDRRPAWVARNAARGSGRRVWAGFGIIGPRARRRWRHSPGVGGGKHKQGRCQAIAGIPT